MTGTVGGASYSVTVVGDWNSPVLITSVGTVGSEASISVTAAASPGAAVGRLAFTASEAVERAAAGEAVLLVRKETNPEDIDGMHIASGILTSTGGMTSHAAVVARGWGRC